MASPINKTTLAHLAALARIKLHAHEEEKLLHDLEKILAHFDELKAVSGDHTVVAYGAELENVFREDDERINTNQGAGVDQFSEQRDGFLEVPAVFEKS